MNPLDMFGTWRFAEPVWLSAAAGVLLVPLLVMAVRRLGERRLARFADRDRLDALVGPIRRWPTVVRCVLGAGACLLIALGLARPQSDPTEIETERTGRNVIFLLDVSRSMLATDVAPNRLDRAKLWINDLISELRGDQFALVAFAGSSTVIAPLTSDRSFFRMALEEVSPESVSRGGTNIGDAIRRTTELLIPPGRGGDGARVMHDLFLITDGEDQESLPVEAARAAGLRGVRIIAIGIGSPEGAMIEARESAVRTRLDISTLREIAEATPGGVFLPVGTGTVDLARLYRDLIASADQESLEQATMIRYTERFAWFLWPLFAVLLIDRLIPVGGRRSAW